MNTFYPQKTPSFTLWSRQSLTTLTIILLILYLTFSVRQLALQNCPQTLSALPSLPSIKPPLTSSQARRTRPMPQCVTRTPRATSLLMLFMGHSGSSAIIMEIGQHPLIRVDEMELVDHQEVFNSTEGLMMAEKFFENTIAGGRIPAFKIRPKHILEDPEAWRTLVNKFGTRIIWNYRKNVFKQAVGEYSNRYLNDKSSVEGLTKNISWAERCKIGAGCHYPIDNFNFLRTTLRGIVNSQNKVYKATGHLFRDQTPCVREIPYEDYLYHRHSVMRDIFQFLGVPHINTVPDRFKATDDNLCNVVENWPELCSQFYGCVLYQSMMDDERNECFCPLSVGDAALCNLD